jgi:hypothetical protein
MSCQRVMRPWVPADVDDAGLLVDLRGDRRLGDLGGADVPAVQVGLVGEVHEVVDQQAGAGLEGLHAADDGPALLVQPRHPREPGALGLVRVTDEDPDEGVLLHHGVGLQPRGARDALLSRDGDAHAVGAVGEAVVPADDGVAVEVAGLLRQREPAVHAAVAHRGDLAGLGPPEQDRLTADGAAEQLATDLAAVRGHVPLVLDDRRHACLQARTPQLIPTVTAITRLRVPDFHIVEVGVSRRCAGGRPRPPRRRGRR